MLNSAVVLTPGGECGGPRGRDPDRPERRLPPIEVSASPVCLPQLRDDAPLGTRSTLPGSRHWSPGRAARMKGDGRHTSCGRGIRGRGSSTPIRCVPPPRRSPRSMAGTTPGGGVATRGSSDTRLPDLAPSTVPSAQLGLAGTDLRSDPWSDRRVPCLRTVKMSRMTEVSPSSVRHRGLRPVSTEGRRPCVGRWPHPRDPTGERAGESS